MAPVGLLELEKTLRIKQSFLLIIDYVLFILLIVITFNKDPLLPNIGFSKAEEQNLASLLVHCAELRNGIQQIQCIKQVEFHCG